MVQPFEDLVSAVLSVTLGDVSLWVLFHFTIVVSMILDLSCVLRMNNDVLCCLHAKNIV